VAPGLARFRKLWRNRRLQGGAGTMYFGAQKQRILVPDYSGATIGPDRLLGSALLTFPENGRVQLPHRFHASVVSFRPPHRLTGPEGRPLIGPSP